jgi:SAM-dependent methyltransferase
MPLYGPDLAYIHHTGFGDFARNAAPGLLRLLRRHGIAGGLVVDLGCGSGIWAAALTRAGYAVHGVDRSAPMIRLARQVAPGATFERGAVESVSLPRCEAVTALGEVLGYAATGRRPSLARAFRRIASALRPGGLFVFDVMVRAGGAPMRYRTWSAGANWVVLAEVDEDVRRHLVRRDIRTFRREGACYRDRVEHHLVHVLDAHDVGRRLRNAGFTVRTSRRYGTYRLAPRRVAFIAQRKGLRNQASGLRAVSGTSQTDALNSPDP